MGYKSIVLYDNEKVDYLIYLSGVATAGEIATANAWAYEPAWADYTNAEIFAPFTDSLVSSYITGLTSPLTGYVIYRQKVGETSLTKVAEVDTNVDSIIDYNVSAKTAYIYIVYPATETELGISMTSDPITTCWWNWSVTELIEISDGIYTAGEVWLFDANLQSSDIVQNLDQTTYRTYSQYPKSSVGLSNFRTLGFSCLLSRVNSTTHTYSDTVALKKAWDALVAAGQPVLLKDPKGNIYYGRLENPSAKMNDIVGTLPVSINVSFVEIGDNEDFTVYEEVS